MRIHAYIGSNDNPIISVNKTKSSVIFSKNCTDNIHGVKSFG